MHMAWAKQCLNRSYWVCMLLSVALTAALLAAMTPEQRSRNIESFDSVWKTIRDQHWSMPAGLEWDNVRDDLRPKVEAAASNNAASVRLLLEHP